MLWADWQVLVRRWYLVAAGLLMTVGLGWAATQAVPVQYEVTSNTLMLPPESVDEDGRTNNPFLGLGGLEGIADVVCKTLTGADAVEEMDRAGLEVDFEMYRDPSAAAPVILTIVQAPSESEALRTQQYLLERIPASLEAVQETTGVRPDARVTSSVFTQDAAATPVRRSQTRALVVAVVAGLAGTYLGAGLIDSALRSRRRPSRAVPTPESGLPTVAAAPPENPSEVTPVTAMFPLPALLRGEKTSPSRPEAGTAPTSTDDRPPIRARLLPSVKPSVKPSVEAPGVSAESSAVRPAPGEAAPVAARPAAVSAKTGTDDPRQPVGPRDESEGSSPGPKPRNPVP